MRRIRALVIACGLVAASASSSRGQGFLIGDVAGFGPGGVSNGYGYGVRRPPPAPGRFGEHMGNLAEKMNALGMRGYYTGLYDPVSSSTGPSQYYQSSWSGINGTPSPEVASRGWGYSPPWSKAYRQGQPRKHMLFSRLHHDD